MQIPILDGLNCEKLAETLSWAGSAGIEPALLAELDFESAKG
jgi:hypothetical protein